MTQADKMAPPPTSDPLALTPTSNPYLDFYNEYCKTSRKDLFAVFDPSISEKKRTKMYKALDVSVAMKYSWAIPDERALRIIKHYGPIVEMGAGTGYWGRLLELRGVDIVCYDLHVADDDEEDGEENAGDQMEQIFWTNVLKGTPKDLRKHPDRTLFLCYPDDFEDSSESMALECLHNYSGEYVIHVGEMFGQTLCLPGPWGRTSSSEFQTHLASVYHKVLQVPLPSWHSSIDALTVWKRTKTSIMDNCFYAFIPEDERLELTAACASTRHLLEDSKSSNASSAGTKRSTPTEAASTTASNNNNDDDSRSSKKAKKRRRQQSS
ncbi:hypothetical protein PINS_up003106 [Pythium insidiosum]|nr:hypothetical protein PINS_up003106 [Pythium insidiosum]